MCFILYTKNHKKFETLYLKGSVADPDPCESVSFWSAGSGSASMKRIRIRVAKNQPKSLKISTKINENHKNIIHFFFKTIKLMFTDLNIYPTNNKTDHISERYFFYIKNSKTKVDIFPILGRIWIRIRSRIRIRYFTKRIRGSGSISKWNGSATLLKGIFYYLQQQQIIVHTSQKDFFVLNFNLNVFLYSALKPQQ